MWIRCLIVAGLALAIPARAQPPCDARGDAHAVVEASDTAIYLDTVLLGEIEAAICAARSRYPELRRIHAGEHDRSLLVFVSTDDSARARIDRTARAERGSANEPTGWTPLHRTGHAVLDSLNRHYGASRIEATSLLGKIFALRIAFSRPAHIRRLYQEYDAAGIETGSKMNDMHLNRGPHSRISWRRTNRFDELRFQFDSECFDPCARSERYVVHVDRRTHVARMVERRDSARR